VQELQLLFHGGDELNFDDLLEEVRNEIEVEATNEDTIEDDDEARRWIEELSGILSRDISGLGEIPMDIDG